MNNYTASDHTFSVCAYKESAFLEKCINSLLKQSVKSRIIICTSTPNEHISSIAGKHNLELRVNTEPPCISGDWNFAYKQAETRLITLAHQDDIYLPGYLETALGMLNSSKKPIIFFSHYAIIKGDDIIYNDKRLNIRRFLNKPLKVWRNSRFIRRRLLSLGNVICCPSVTYADLDSVVFPGEYTYCLDWYMWEKLSKLHGSFVYCEKPLMYHRLHEDGETAIAVQDGTRRHEDYLMFKMFWCAPVAKLLTGLYTKK